MIHWLKVCLLGFMCALSVSGYGAAGDLDETPASTMRTSQVFELIESLGGVFDDRAHYLQERLRRSVGARGERRVGEEVISQIAGQLTSNENTKTIVAGSLRESLLLCQQTGVYKDLFLTALKTRRRLVRDRTKGWSTSKEHPVDLFSQFEKINQWHFGGSPNWGEGSGVLAKEADESKGFLDDLSYVINTVINWSWNRILDKTVLGDSGWDLVNKSPSVWPLLEGADHIETIGIDHGTPYNLINAIATKLFGDRKETLDVYCDVPELNQVQREKLRSGTPDKHIYMIAEAAVREFFPRAIKWKSEEGKDYPTLSEEQYNNLMGRNIMIRDAAKKLVSNYKRTLRPIINNTDFIHDGELSALRFSYEAVHHPLMPKEETVSSEDKGFLDFPNPTSKPKQKRQKKKKKAPGKPNPPKHKDEEEASAAVAAPVEEKSLYDEMCERQELSLTPLEGAYHQVDTSLIGDTDAPPYDVFDITEALQKEYPYDYPRPARMRPEILEQEHPIRVLTDDQQAKADRIFSAPPHTITYQEFESLWTSLGGSMRGEKGSHRTMITPDGAAMWGTYIPHGGHNYGPHGIKNLRAALYWMGCRPTE